ncbi:hypothetical protein BH18ACT1_BH18ACT1_06800 [soil metagenome]
MGAVLMQPQDLDAAPSSGRAQWAGVLALLSLAAGFLHAAMIDGHRGHGIVAQLFTAFAIFQVAWAALVLARPNRAVLLLGALGNAAVAVGYLVSRTTGIGFIDGLEETEAIGFTDGATTALEVLLVGGALLLLVAAPARRLWPTGRIGFAGLGATGLAVALVAVPATASAGDHVGNDHDSHTAAATADDHGGDTAAAGEDHAAHGGDAEATDAAASGGHDHAEMSYFDALDSATPDQREAAAKLLTDTRDGLWQWVDDKKVYEAGFRTIRDGATGTEHLVNWNWINDDVVLDPNAPESLVYRVEPDGTKTLEAAMFMAPGGPPDDAVPDVGGPITQWHIHNNLCYSPAEMVDGAPQRLVVGLANDGTCTTGEYLSPHAPMLHVWTVEKECGPFSSLEGVGAGQAITEKADANEPEACQHSVAH